MNLVVSQNICNNINFLKNLDGFRATNIFYFMIHVLKDDADSDKHDPIQEKFEMILQDITVYYTKKLDLLRIKSEQHQVIFSENVEYHDCLFIQKLKISLKLCMFTV